jgi:hypothetical protein
MAQETHEQILRFFGGSSITLSRSGSVLTVKSDGDQVVFGPDGLAMFIDMLTDQLKIMERHE